MQLNAHALDSVLSAYVFDPDIIAQQRQCVVCNRGYTESENVGAWKCHQHPGRIRDCRWTCCNLPVPWDVKNEDAFYAAYPLLRHRGCQRCDHRTVLRPYTEYDCIALSRSKLKAFAGVLAKSVVALAHPDAPQAIIVWRFEVGAEPPHPQ